MFTQRTKCQRWHPEAQSLGEAGGAGTVAGCAVTS